jgi:hypothetical protein
VFGEQEAGGLEEEADVRQLTIDVALYIAVNRVVREQVWLCKQSNSFLLCGPTYLNLTQIEANNLLHLLIDLRYLSPRSSHSIFIG